MRGFLTLTVFLVNALVAFSQNSTVSFNLNYRTDQVIHPVTVKTGCALPAEAKTFPVREGRSYTPVAFYGVKSLSQDMGTLSPSGLMGPVRLELCK
jgi:hypothetical protein